MFRPLVRSHRRPPRRGTAILITCFFLITIMMVTGLALVMYAAREKAAALAYQEGGTRTLRAAPAPEGTVNAFLSALIYDTADDGSALQNSLRGHSIARGMYGSRSDYTVPTDPWSGSETPWAGVGLFNEDTGSYTHNGSANYNALTALTQAEQRNRARFVNHTALQLGTQFLLLDPERTGNRYATGGNLPTFATSLTGRAYVGKHAGYTYPDLKSFFLGAQDPTTGEVIQPSFHRDWLFRDSTRPATESPLAPTNPNWTNDIGKLLTLRPRPAEHPNFPRVPPNADGTYTGDVQNLTGNYVFVPNQSGGGGRFVAKNDSQWMHIGLPPITLPDGRTVQPMVAPLILPLDGRFDLSIHGNRLGASSAHSSYGGYGPWEVNLGFGTANEPDRQALTFSDPTATPPTGRYASRNAEFNPFASGQLLPIYGGVAWNGSQVGFKLPSEQLVAPDNRLLLGLPTTGDAAYSGGQYGNFQNDNQQIANHPAGYNPNEFAPRDNTTNPNSPVYPYSDLKRFSLRYAFTPDWYGQAFAAKTARDTFSPDPTTSVYEYLPNPGATTLPSTGKQSYRLDPTHTRRNLFVPRAMSLDRPALAPNFVSRDGTTAFQIVAGQTKPGALFTTATQYPSPQTPGQITDFASATQWYNVMAALGSVDLNRPLTDYRNDTTKALGTDTSGTGGHVANAGNAAQAEADRQALAKDIFARLIIATGAAAKVSFDSTNGVQIALPDPANAYQIATTPPVTATVDQYNALRYLAQLAVNVVDYIDNDDISTTFAWNPSNPTNPPAGYATDMLAANIGNRAVFGVEKPRLLLNEVYSEITNAPDDLPVDPVIDPATMMPTALGPMKQAHVKFWTELVNATSAPHTAATGVLGNGAVPLNAYQIQIGRAERTTGVAMTQNLANALFSPMDAAYASNVAGAFGAAADATFTFPATPPANTPSTVSPNDVTLGAQQYAPPQANLPAGGFVLVGPPQADKMGSKEFTPPATGLWAGTNKVESVAPTAATTSTAMGYTVTMPAAAVLSSGEFKRHVVLLRRLTNPYLPVNDPNVAAPPTTQLCRSTPTSRWT